MRRRSQLPLILALVVALALIVGAIVYVSQDAPEALPPSAVEEAQPLASDPLETVAPIQADDHVFGNPNAPLVLVVYSDFQCPFCEEYHKTMHGIMELFGKEGSVAWVYRHFPFVDMHPESPMYALASECAASLGGNDAFWNYSDGLYDIISPDYAATPSDLVALAGTLGLERVAFASCMRTNELMDEVEADFNEAIRAGADATPFTVIFTGDTPQALTGAQPFPEFAGLIKALIEADPNRPLTAPSATFDASDFDAFISATSSTSTTATTTP